MGDEVCKVCGGRASTCSVLGHRPSSDKTNWQLSAQERLEVEAPSELFLLRKFYKAWQDLHSIQHPHAKVNRGRAEAQAQLLVDAAMEVNALYHNNLNG